MRFGKELYLERRDRVMRVTGLTMEELNTNLRSDFEEYTVKVGTEVFVKKLAEIDDNTLNVSLSNLGSSDTDYIYFYKRGLQFVTATASEYKFGDVIDISVLDSIDRDVFIECYYGTNTLQLCLYKKLEECVIGNSALSWTLEVNVKGISYPMIFLFEPSNKMLKVFVGNSDSKCDRCSHCRQTSGMLCILPVRYDECAYYKDFPPVGAVLKTVETVLNEYVNRAKRKWRSSVKSLGARSVMVAKVHDDDSEVLMPLDEYVYEYKESKRSEWKGGHHSAPSAHIRRGYYRKSNRGDHIRVGDEFIRVPKGTGNFTYVGSSKVNWDNDNVVKTVVRQ